MVKRSVNARFFISTILALALPTLAPAQQRGAGIAPAPAGRAATGIPRASSATVHVGVRAGTPAGARIGAPIVRSRNQGHVIHRGERNNFNGTDFNGASFQDVPGLGFDYPHLAAVNGNRHGHGRRFNGGAPFGFGGFLLSPSVVVEQPAEIQDGDEVADIPADDPTAPRRSRIFRPALQPEIESLPPAPPRDVEQYVLVRRDGGLVFAVAYTWDNATLRYITPDGFRRSIGRDALDLSATQQFNEQRGLNFRAPA